MRMPGLLSLILRTASAAGDLQADIEAASELTTPQRKALVEIYRGFLDANTVRRARGEHQGD